MAAGRRERAAQSQSGTSQPLSVVFPPSRARAAALALALACVVVHMARLARWNAALVPLLAVVLWLCTVPTSAGVERVYYIAADGAFCVVRVCLLSITRSPHCNAEVLWNYAPLDWNEIRGAAINQMGSSSSFFFSNDESRIGSTYIKAKYRYASLSLAPAQP